VSDFPTDVVIEFADSTDTATLTELWVDLAADQRRYGSHLLAEPNRTAIRETMLRHVVTDTACVARRDGSIVGFVTFDVETERYRQDVSRGVIYNVYVRPDHRGSGIGHGLLAEAEAALQTEDVDTVSLQVMAENDGARRFYRRHGYDPHRVELEKPINSDPQSGNDG
jgi:ribosomal protein S18 acetylase RimI-like enzyme